MSDLRVAAVKSSDTVTLRSSVICFRFFRYRFSSVAVSRVYRLNCSAAAVFDSHVKLTPLAKRLIGLLSKLPDNPTHRTFCALFY